MQGFQIDLTKDWEFINARLLSEVPDKERKGILALQID